MKPTGPKTLERMYAMKFGSVYPLYVTKVKRKGKTQAELDEVIRWLTGYTQKGMEAQIKKESTFETFFAKAPRMNPKRALITGTICGVKLEEIKESLFREMRYLDKVVDELAKGRAMEKIKR